MRESRVAMHRIGHVEVARRFIFSTAFLITLLVVLGFETQGQLSEPALTPGGVRITFLPPPLDGTLSTGVYSVDGKLVRTLAREASDRDFTVGLNGFITHWDGRDESAKALPPGKYFVRGYAVGMIDIQGVAFHGNDWLSDDDSVPRIVDILAMQIEGPELLLVGRGAGSNDCVVRLSRESREMKFEPFERQALSEEKPTVRFSSATAKALASKSLGLTGAIDTAPSPGRVGTSWTILPTSTESSTGAKVLQRSADGAEILRELDIERDQPQPCAIAAAPDREEIYLLERSESEIRVRGLRLQKTQNADGGKAISDWEVFLSKSIHLSPLFEKFVSQLKRTPSPRLAEKVRVVPIANELYPAAPAALQLGVGRDEKGSFLHTVDGLLLRRLTDTQNLRWAALTLDPDGAVSLFQSDGAAVEEYRLRQLDQVMAFDAGEYELPAAK